MGIFFDQDWFDERLKAAGLSRAGMAQAAGMTVDEIEMVFADRRELEGAEVHAIAHYLSVEPREVAGRSGAADPGAIVSAQLTRSLRPGDQGPGQGMPAQGFVMTREVIAGLHERIDRLEQMLERVLARLEAR